MNQYLCVLVDDDPINNHMNKVIIRRNFPDLKTVDFIDPAKGLEFIFTNKEYDRILLLLDIFMPVMNGWDCLGVLKNLPSKALERIEIFMLTSSIDARDQQRADKDPNVKGFLTKPLTDENLKKSIIGKLKVSL